MIFRASVAEDGGGEGIGGTIIDNKDAGFGCWRG